MRTLRAAVIFLSFASSFAIRILSKTPLPVCCDQEKEGDVMEDYAKICYKSFENWKGHSIHWEYRYSITLCGVAAIGTFHEETKFTIDQFGKLILPADKNSCGIFTPTIYQVDWTNWTEEGEGMSNPQFCLDRNNTTFGAYICTESENSGERTNDKDPPVKGQSICMIISAAFLLMTSFILLTVKTKKSKNVEFIPYLVSQSISLALAFICNARVLFKPLITNCWECIIAGYCVQYFFLAAFFWMNAFCIMMYMTMSQMKPGNHKHFKAKTRRQRRFIRFSIYAWGMPLLITCATFILQLTIIDTRMKPNLGVDSCFFRSGVIKWAYYDGPIGVIVITNIILYMLIAHILARQHRRLMNIKIGRKHKSRLNTEIQYFNRFMKLFIVTGFGWIGEILGSGFPDHSNPLVWYLFKVVDYFNCLHGVFIFFFFICQDEILLRRLPKTFKWGSDTPSEALIFRCCLCLTVSNTGASGKSTINERFSMASIPESSDQENP